MTTLNKQEANTILNAIGNVDPAFADIDLLRAIVKLREINDSPVMFKYHFSNSNSSLRIPVIKAVRIITGFGLKEAKDFVDSNTTFSSDGIIVQINSFDITSTNDVDVACIWQETNCTVIKTNG